MLLNILLAATAVALPPDLCSTRNMIQSLVPPGSSWSWDTINVSSVHFVDGTLTPPPTQIQVDAAIANCQANLPVLQAFTTELSTTTTSVGNYPNLIAPTTTQQAQTVRDMARIFFLRQQLGLQ